MRCPQCFGSGVDLITLAPCSFCGGTGQISDDYLTRPSCKYCFGSGRHPLLISERCPVCGGSGRVPDAREEEEASEPRLPIAFIEAGKPRTAHLQLKSFFDSLSGDIRICDPFYGVATLYRLDLVVHCDSVRFLTRKVNAYEEAQTHKAIRLFQKEHPHVEFRKHTASQLHDRYLLTDDELILIGHGLKDIGGKESFVVRLNQEFARGVIRDVRTAFDQKWAKATPIP